MTRGADVSATGRARAHARAGRPDCWAERGKAGRARVRERRARAARAASGWAEQERGGKEVARDGILFFFFKNVNSIQF
jgi:hypothetical protein